LLTDGLNNSGEIDPITSAQIAQMLGIRLYTIGLGKNDSVMFPVQTMFGIQNQKFISKLDKVTLKEMAHISNGEFFEAVSNKDLTEIFNKIYFLEKNTKEIANNKNGKVNNTQCISYEMAMRLLNAVKIQEDIIMEKIKNDNR